MDKPTVIAEDAFQFAKSELRNVKTTLESKDGLDYHLRSALSEMAWGLQNLSIGLRATYILLEQVQRDLRRAG
jgi:hypothetical protein